MKHPTTSATSATSAIAALLAAAVQPSRSQTVIEVSSAVAVPSVKRFGLGLAQTNYYDSGQMMKELLLRNPGFEGLLYQSVERIGAATAVSAVEDAPFTQWPSGFWDGAAYEIITGPAKGRSGIVAHSLAPSRTGLPNDPAGSPMGTTWQFAESGAAPQPGDYLILRKTRQGDAFGGAGAAAAGWNVSAGGGGTVVSEAVDLPPGTAGTQCVRLTALTAGQTASLSGSFDTLSERFVLLNGPHRLRFRAKGAGGARRLLVQVRRGSLPHYVSQSVNLTDSWRDYQFGFTASETPAVTGAVSVTFAAVSQSALLLDDVSLRQSTEDPANPGEFRDPVVAAIRDFRPATLRFPNWQTMGDSLENTLAAPLARKPSGYSNFSTSASNLVLGLHEFLELCELTGADPWYSIPPVFSSAEAAGLMEYLGGDASTPWGAVRAARGHPAPWTGVFSRIHLELGNENWNNGSYRGAAISAPAALGERATDLFAVIRASPYYAPAQVNLILGGQAGNPRLNQAIHQSCGSYDSLCLAPYMASQVDVFATSEDLYGPLFAEPEWWSQRPSPASGLMRGAFDMLRNSGRPVALSVYEVNLHTTGGAISQAALDSFTPSVGAGIAVADHMLTMLRELQARDQLWFSLPGWRFTRADSKTVALWGLSRDYGVTDRRRPHYFAGQLVNEALAGDMVRTTHSGDDPVWNQPLQNRVQFTGAHFLQSFACSHGSEKALIVFNLHRSSHLDVGFSGPNAPSGSVTMKRLTSAAITDSNETVPAVAVVTQTAEFADPAAPVSLPPFSMTLLKWTQAPVDAWRHRHFQTTGSSGSAADHADPDQDGIENLCEYALGTDPLDPASFRVPAASLTPGPDGGRLTVELVRDPEASGVACSVEVSPDLSAWVSGAPHLTVIHDDGTLLRVRDNTPPPSGRRFIRIRVTRLPLPS